MLTEFKKHGFVPELAKCNQRSVGKITDINTRESNKPKAKRHADDDDDDD